MHWGSGTILRWAMALTALCATSARAGGGPENVLLVINQRSFVSVTLGNYYARLRQIPPSHILHLDWPLLLDSTDLPALRERVLGPVMSELQQRGLADQIDYVVYSADFPPAVDFGADMPRKPTGRDKPIAALTALTYFSQAVLDGNVNGYASLTANQYFQPVSSDGVPLSLAFTAQSGWSNGSPSDAARPRYLLSVMLSVTSGRGISLRDSVDSLRRSATADATAPDGVIYYMTNPDIRTQVRMPLFSAAITELRRIGVEAQTMAAVLPLRKDDVAGAQLGNPNLPLAEARMTILPGALCENLTSAAGVFVEAARQTPCTELLKYGAAGASGTVTEPYAVPQKFPTAFIQVHYARGCSLAEAFYQSVQGPFQLLIVGDPLCQPWAKPAGLELRGPAANETVRGAIELTPSRPAGAARARYELFADGRRVGSATEGQPLRLDTSTLADGWHELRVVAIDETPIAAQSRRILGVMVDNHGRRLDLTAASPRVAFGQTLELEARCPGADTIDILQGSRSLGVIEGQEGALSVAAEKLGLGPIVLRAVARSGGAEYAVSSPLAVDVGPGPALPAQTAPTAMSSGLRLTTAAGESRLVGSTAAYKWLEEAGVGGNQEYQLEGWFEVDADDIYQFQVRQAGQLTLEVDGQLRYSGEGKFDAVSYVPVVLAKGSHRLTIRGKSGNAARLDIRFGGPGSYHLAAPRFNSQR